MIKVEKLIKTQVNTASRFWREITTPKTKTWEVKAKHIKTEIKVDSRN